MTLGGSRGGAAILVLALLLLPPTGSHARGESNTLLLTSPGGIATFRFGEVDGPLVFTIGGTIHVDGVAPVELALMRNDTLQTIYLGGVLDGARIGYGSVVSVHLGQVSLESPKKSGPTQEFSNDITLPGSSNSSLILLWANQTDPLTISWSCACESPSIGYENASQLKLPGSQSRASVTVAAPLNLPQGTDGLHLDQRWTDGKDSAWSIYSVTAMSSSVFSLGRFSFHSDDLDYTMSLDHVANGATRGRVIGNNNIACSCFVYQHAWILARGPAHLKLNWAYSGIEDDFDVLSARIPDGSIVGPAITTESRTPS